MSNIQIGTMKPEYLAAAANMKAVGNNHLSAGKRAMAMSRHPAAASRSAEFHQQAQTHLNAAKSIRSSVQAMPSNPAGSFSPSSANTSSRSRSALN